jgi:hypothetical protein
VTDANRPVSCRCLTRFFASERAKSAEKSVSVGTSSGLMINDPYDLLAFVLPQPLVAKTSDTNSNDIA